MPGQERIEFLFRKHAWTQQGRNNQRTSNLQLFPGSELLEAFADRHAASRAVDERDDESRDLTRIQSEQHGLDRADSGRRKRECAISDRNQGERAERLRCKLPADRHWLAMRACALGNNLECAQDRSGNCIETVGHSHIAAIGSVEELNEVVSSDGKEIDTIEQLIELV